VTRQIWRSEDTADILGLPIDGAHQGGSVPTGQIYHPEERVTVREAIDAYTRHAAYASFQDSIGTLTAGKLADLVVLSEDPFSVDPGQIARIRPTLTMVGGKVVYGAAP
jgi:hypothetical protein